MVNGYRTGLIKILRCIKQGDAFSCGLFIICIDPLIRNIELNRKIKAIEIQTPMSHKKIKPKTGAFADDVGTLTMGDTTSINEVFCEYVRFSSLSGIEINEGKTEIMHLGVKGEFNSKVININNGLKSLRINTVESIKICGITFSNNNEIAYKANVLDKLDKFKEKILAWQYRNLTLSGKILVSKVFGVSQLIYSMQSCLFNEKDIKISEAFLFKFLWTKNVNGNRAPDRIKRSILKCDYDKGGLKVTDLSVLDKALKLRQFFRANKSNHPIKDIQKWISESLNYDHVILQEYSRVTKLECIFSSAQLTLNNLTDKFREGLYADLDSGDEILGFKIDLIASTDVEEFLIRKGSLLIRSVFKTLLNLGIENFKQLVSESMHPRSDNIKRITEFVLRGFPKKWRELIESNIGCNSLLDIRANIVLDDKKVSTIYNCTVKTIKNRLITNSEIFIAPFESKLGIRGHDNINPFLTARICNYSTNLRTFKFRLLHMDIFTKERMFKYKMTESNRCDHCMEIETVKHVLWDCRRAREVWVVLGEIMQGLNLGIEVQFENLFIGYNPTNRVIEGIITRLSQIILRIDRQNGIETNTIKTEILQLAKINFLMPNKKIPDSDLWKKIIIYLS